MAAAVTYIYEHEVQRARVLDKVARYELDFPGAAFIRRWLLVPTRAISNDGIRNLWILQWLKVWSLIARLRRPESCIVEDPYSM